MKDPGPLDIEELWCPNDQALNSSLEDWSAIFPRDVCHKVTPTTCPKYIHFYLFLKPNCFQNGVQIWKGIDRKTDFCRVRHKKCRDNGKTFFFKPVKNCFLIETFSYLKTILRTHNFLSQNHTFL